LLIRDRRSVVLTDAGEIFLQEACGILNQSEHAGGGGAARGQGRIGEAARGNWVRAGACGEAGAVLVASGTGIHMGVGAVRSKPGGSNEVVLVPLDDPNAKVDAQVAWRRAEMSGVVLAFLQTVRRIFRHNW
jgi:DNA-binding transcriptional LysR family regulator